VFSFTNVVIFFLMIQLFVTMTQVLTVNVNVQ
jgi:hypothetical protein